MLNTLVERKIARVRIAILPLTFGSKFEVAVIKLENISGSIIIFKNLRNNSPGYAINDSIAMGAEQNLKRKIHNRSGYSELLKELAARR